MEVRNKSLESALTAKQTRKADNRAKREDIFNLVKFIAFLAVFFPWSVVPLFNWDEWSRAKGFKVIFGLLGAWRIFALILIYVDTYV